MLQGIQGLEVDLAKQHSVDVASCACCILHHTHAVVSKQCPKDVAVKQALLVFQMDVLRLVVYCIHLHADEDGNGDNWRFTELYICA